MAILASVFFLMSYFAYKAINLPRPLYQKVNLEPVAAPAVGLSEEQLLQREMSAISSIQPGSFSLVFGILPDKDAVKKAVESKKLIASKPVEIEKKVELKPAVDLEAAGYKLKGVIKEKGGNSAAFIYDPGLKRTVVARELGTGSIRLLSVATRMVRVATEKGEGILKLENSIGSEHSSPSFVRNSGPVVTIHENKGTLSDLNPGRVARLIQKGKLKVTSSRGMCRVEIKEVPDEINGYDVNKGDIILGTSKGDFRKSGEVAEKLGRLGAERTALKVWRKGRVILVQPPLLKENDVRQPLQKK